MAIYDLLRPSEYVPKELYQERLKLCNECPERLEKNNGRVLRKLSRCPECGCIISLKAKLYTEECPLGDW